MEPTLIPGVYNKWGFYYSWVGAAKNILRLKALVTIISKQYVIVPEQKLRALFLKKVLRNLVLGTNAWFKMLLPMGTLSRLGPSNYSCAL